jgi:predicted hydrolase (HD superfamily)
LISIDELSGLMFAYARMRGGSFEGMEVKWVIKKIKDKSFAAGVDREHVRNCETYLGIALEDFVGQMIDGFLGL